MARFKGKRILVVEDEVVIGFAIEDMLASLGCEVTGIAHQMKPALELVEMRQFDAAVLDVNISGELSFAIADALAAKGVPYIFATGYGDALHPKAHLSAPTLTKPFSIDDLADALMRFFV